MREPRIVCFRRKSIRWACDEPLKVRMANISGLSEPRVRRNQGGLDDNFAANFVACPLAHYVGATTGVTPRAGLSEVATEEASPAVRMNFGGSSFFTSTYFPPAY